MNEKNLEYLKNNLRHLGFGDSLQRPLEANVKEGKAEFTLNHKATYNNQAMDSTLSFRRGEQNEMYFFNKYSASITKPEERSQTFYIDKGNGVTSKEAFNLLNGRAVNKELTGKEGQKYNAWIQLDLSAKDESGNFKLNRYHENYGYDLPKALAQYPVKELNDPVQAKELIRSLEKGNLQAVRMEAGGKEGLYFIQADPQFKGIILYDRNQQKLGKEATGELKVQQAVNEPGRNYANTEKNNQAEAPSVKNTGDVKESAKQTKQSLNSKQPEADDGPELKKKRTRKKGMKI